MAKKIAPTWEYEAKLVRVLDGDTAIFTVTKVVSQEVDFGFYVKDVVSLTKTAEVSFRFAGINAPETHDPNPKLAKRGSAAKAEVERLLSLGTIRLVSYKPDKYGRWLADVYVSPFGEKEICVNKALIEGGFALPYDGKGEKPV